MNMTIIDIDYNRYIRRVKEWENNPTRLNQELMLRAQRIYYASRDDRKILIEIDEKNKRDWTKTIDDKDYKRSGTELGLYN